MEVALKERMLKTLEELEDEDFDTFKWFLEQIPKYHVKRANRIATVDLIMQKYPSKEAEVMVNVLKKINRNDLLESFADIPKSVSDVPDTSGNSAASSHEPNDESACDALLPPEPQTRKDFIQWSALDALLPPESDTRKDVIQSLNDVPATLGNTAAYSQEPNDAGVDPETSGNSSITSSQGPNEVTGLAINVLNQTRTDMLQYSCPLSLDLNTTADRLVLSKENRNVTFRLDKRPISFYPNHPERFEYDCQVLCRESVSERCYWEVEWHHWAAIAVSYKDIDREGTKSTFKNSNKSWAFIAWVGWRPYRFSHNNITTEVSGPRSTRVGVYLDHKAGILSFYSVTNNTLTLLHTIQTTFTQPLYPGIGLLCSHHESTAEICKIW